MAVVAKDIDTRAATVIEHTEWMERRIVSGKVPLLSSDKGVAAGVHSNGGAGDFNLDR